MKHKLRNYYDIYKISPDASAKEINDKHRSLAKKYHPDISNDEDAHVKMTILNEAYEVLSDSDKRAKYDKKLQAEAVRTEKVKKQQSTAETENRAEKAEQMRIKTEARLRAEEAVRMQRMAHAKKRAEEKARQLKQDEFIRTLVNEKTESDKEQAVNYLKMLVRQGNARLSRNEEADEDRLDAMKVLLSLVKDDNAHLRKLTEEAERKQRIEEIIALVNESKEETNK